MQIEIALGIPIRLDVAKPFALHRRAGILGDAGDLLGLVARLIVKHAEIGGLGPRPAVWPALGMANGQRGSSRQDTGIFDVGTPPFLDFRQHEFAVLLQSRRHLNGPLSFPLQVLPRWGRLLDLLEHAVQLAVRPAFPAAGECGGVRGVSLLE